MMSVFPSASGTPLETTTKTVGLRMGGREASAACRAPGSGFSLLSQGRSYSETCKPGGWSGADSTADPPRRGGRAGWLKECVWSPEASLQS